MPRKGERIGPYTLIEKLGRGSFGVVWLAENRAALAITKVALKLPNDEDIDLETIKQEASLWVAASGHPNVLPIIEANIYDEQVVIVSEYAPDGSLAAWLKNNGGKAPTIKEAVEITLGIMSGLEHLHSRKIIHRDLKPANILLQGSTPRLVDFGLSRVMRSTSHSRAVSGTYQYMPPESFKGERSPQTDIWSAGVILFEMLCGRLPFPQQDDPSLLYAILNDPPAVLPSSVPDRLSEVITKALSKDTSERYKTAAEMREKLTAILHPFLQTQSETHEPVTRSFLRANEQQTLVLPQEPVNTSPSPRQEADTLKDIPEIRRQNITQQITEPPKKISRRALLFGFGAFASVLLVSLIGVKVLLFSSLDNVAKSPNTNRLESPVTMGQSSNTNQPTGTPTVTQQSGNLPKEFINKDGMKFILIPAGSFMMGSPESEEGHTIDEAPIHQITIDQPFYLCQYEVTQAQWEKVTGKNQSIFQGDNMRPVESVSWNDVQGFIRELNTKGEGIYRLPTEAEWEYAARANTDKPYNDLKEVAWFESNSGNRTNPVGRLKPNAWGLFDMQGNVSEWIQDNYSVSYYQNSPAVNPQGPDTGNKRVIRGGSWNDIAFDCRRANREAAAPEKRNSLIGFRLVLIKK